jgi:hypothetical protein
MGNDNLTVQLTGKDRTVPLSGLLRVMDSTRVLLGRLDAATRSADVGPADWHVSDAALNSPMLLEVTEVSGRGGDRGPRVFREVVNGLSLVDVRAVMPPHFDSKMLHAAKDMVSALGDGIAAIALATGDLVARPTQRIAAHVDRLTRPYEAFGTVEGLLEAVNAHGEQRFYIYDTLTGHRTPCTFGDQHRDTVKQALFDRVSVTGLAKFDPEGQAISLRVERVDVLSDSRRGAEFFRVPPIDITHGVDPADYIEALRDDED